MFYVFYIEFSTTYCTYVKFRALRKIFSKCQDFIDIFLVLWYNLNTSKDYQNRGLGNMESRKLHYHFEYVNENEFRKKERSVRKYNMLAYKKLTFEYYPSIREGKFLGKLISTDAKEHSKTYELKLPTCHRRRHGSLFPGLGRFRMP